MSIQTNNIANELDGTNGHVIIHVIWLGDHNHHHPDPRKERLADRASV